MVSAGEVREIQDRLVFYRDAVADLLSEVDKFRPGFRDLTLEQVLDQIRGERVV